MTAAAISVSSSLSDLSRAGVESARVAFRIAVHVERVSRLIEPRADDEQPQSWAYVVTGLGEKEVQEEVDNFNASTVSSIPKSTVAGIRLHQGSEINHDGNFSPVPNSTKSSSAQQTRHPLVSRARRRV